MSLTLFEQKDKIGILKINRPKALNALNRELLQELCTLLEGEIRNKDIRVLIVTGEGEKAFIAGADIKEMQSLSNLEMLSFLHLGQKTTCLLEDMDMVTIAAVNGFALGGGLEIALACDFIYAAETSKMGFPEVSLGIIPGFGGTQRLSRAVGTRMAKELVCSGKMVDAMTAHQIGLVNKICKADALMEDASLTANKILQNGFTAALQAKQSIDRGYPLSLKDALALERNMCTVCFGTKDREEGMQAFIEKRKPKFT
jgi:enoyl-CoA hydratase